MKRMTEVFEMKRPYNKQGTNDRRKGKQCCYFSF